VEGDACQRSGVVHDGESLVSQSRDGLVSVPRALGLVRIRMPVKVEKEIRLGGNFPTRHQGGTVGRECRDGVRESCCGGVYLRGGADESYASKAALVAHQNR